MRELARASRSVLHGINTIAVLQHLKRRKHQAHFTPKRGDEKVLAPGTLGGGDEFFTVTRVHAGTFDGRLMGKQLEELRGDVAAKLSGFDSGQDYWHAEDFRRFRQHE